MRDTAPLLPVLCLAVAGGDPCAPDPDSGQTPYYAQTTWPSAHGSAGNADRVSIVAPAELEVAWTALDGAATLLAPTIGPGGRRYVTTGRGFGTSHLHAFDRDGSLVWESPPFASGLDLGPWAVWSAPVIDCDGDVYVSDSDQLFAFRSNGSIKWVASLALLGAINGFVSAFLTNDGWVGGITTDGRVLLFDRANGALARPQLQLPGGPGPFGPLGPPGGVWGGGLLDPGQVADAYYTFFGFRVEVANTPCVHPDTGRIFVTAAGGAPSQGVLYGIDVGSNELEIAFAALIGPVGGSSPSLSPSGDAVYAADGDGTMYAVDPTTGDILWSTPGLGGSASPGIGADGTIYSGSGSGPDGVLTALRPDGSVRWSVSYDALAAAALAPLPPLPPLFIDGTPTAKVNSVATAAAREVWVVLALGYDVVPVFGEAVHQPRQSLLARIDPEDGSVLSTVPLRDTSEGVVSISPEGDVYVSHAALQSSIFYYGVNFLVPPAYQVAGPPAAGFTALRPSSPRAHTLEGVIWASELAATARATLATRSVASARESLRKASYQSDVLLSGIDDAVAANELEASVGGLARLFVQSARDHLREARSMLGTSGAEGGTDGQIELALTDLLEARGLLEQ